MELSKLFGLGASKIEKVIIALFYSKIGLDYKEIEGHSFGEYIFRKTGMPRLKMYLDEMPGVPLQDIWTDINPAGLGKEAQGYPTQKPELLLERIVKTSSNEGDVVLDPFCGCGTAIAVAYKLKRNFVGINVSPTSCNLMEKEIARTWC